MQFGHNDFNSGHFFTGVYVGGHAAAVVTDFQRPVFVLNNIDLLADTGDGLIDGSTGAVTRRGFVSKLGHRLVFFDDDADSGIALITADDGFRFALNETDRVVKVASDGTIEIGAQGDVELENQGGVTIKSSGNISIEASANLELKAGGTVTIDGAMINIG